MRAKHRDGGSNEFSAHMKKCRAEYLAIQKSRWKAEMAGIEAAVSHTLDAVVNVATKDLEEAVEKLADDNEKIREELDMAISERDEARDEWGKFEKAVIAITFERDGARAETSRYQGESSRQQGEVDRLNQEVGGIRVKLTAKEEQIEEMEKQATADAEKINHMAEEIERLKGRLRLLE